jgi:hypothetical protein
MGCYLDFIGDYLIKAKGVLLWFGNVKGFDMKHKISVFLINDFNI